MTIEITEAGAQGNEERPHEASMDGTSAVNGAKRIEHVPKTSAELMREFLAHRAVLCPTCRYNLHGSDGPACPECGLALHLDVVGRRPGSWPGLTLLLAFAVPLGLYAPLAVVGTYAALWSGWWSFGEWLVLALLWGMLTFHVGGIIYTARRWATLARRPLHKQQETAISVSVFCAVMFVATLFLIEMAW
ncbi:MAG: hypothetical protein AAF432_07275 [Planctomycetota bacterium]